MISECYTFDDVRIAIYCCSKKQRRKIIYDVADFCGNWKIHKLLIESRDIINYSIYRSIAYEFSKLSKNSKDDFYVRLFNILHNYFDSIANMLTKRYENSKISQFIGNYTYSTYLAIKELFGDGSLVDSNKVVKVKQTFESVVTENGMVIDIKWKECN